MRVIAATLLMVFVDQLTKYFFYDQKLWSDIFITTLNTGAAWGVGIPVGLIILVAIAATVWMIIMWRDDKRIRWIVALFIGGVWSNIVDRIFYGGVRDFIYIADRYPIFNIADSMIMISVLALIIFEYRLKSLDKITSDH